MVNPIRRCGQFFAAGKQKSFGIVLDELLLVKELRFWVIIGTAWIILHSD